jgi:hypothetical protein
MIWHDIQAYRENKRAEKENRRRGDDDLRRREVEALEQIAETALDGCPHTRPQRGTPCD